MTLQKVIIKRSLFENWKPIGKKEIADLCEITNELHRAEKPKSDGLSA